MQQVLMNSVITGVGCFGAGFIMGYGLKKVIRLLVIAVGAIAGVIFIVIALMQRQGYVSDVKWDRTAGIHVSKLDSN